MFTEIVLIATCDEITQSTLLGHPNITTEKFNQNNPPDGACVNGRVPMSTFAGMGAAGR